MASFLNIFGMWLGISFICFVIEKLFAPNTPQITPPETRKTDFIYWGMFTPIIKPIFAGALVVWLLAGPVELTKKMLSVPEVTRMGQIWLRQPVVLQIIEATFIADFLAYWLHRLSHAKLLWRFHAIHHSSPRLSWISYYRMHPIDVFVSRLPAAYIFLIADFEHMFLVPYGAALLLLGTLQHTNVNWTFGKLGYVLSSPVFHHWHHTTEAEGMNKNFALVFPIFDRLFGTYYMPKEKLPTHYGIKGASVPESYWSQIKHPFLMHKR